MIMLPMIQARDKSGATWLIDIALNDGKCHLYIREKVKPPEEPTLYHELINARPLFDLLERLDITRVKIAAVWHNVHEGSEQ